VPSKRWCLPGGRQVLGTQHPGTREVRYQLGQPGFAELGTGPVHVHDVGARSANITAVSSSAAKCPKSMTLMPFSTRLRHRIHRPHVCRPPGGHAGCSQGRAKALRCDDRDVGAHVDDGRQLRAARLV
jgi:hypothetical protein